MIEVLSAEAVWKFMHAQLGRVFRKYPGNICNTGRQMNG